MITRCFSAQERVQLLRETYSICQSVHAGPPSTRCPAASGESEQMPAEESNEGSNQIIPCSRVKSVLHPLLLQVWTGWTVPAPLVQ